MGQIRCIFLIFALLLGVTGSSFAQKNGPPSPTEKRHKGPPCNPGNGNGNGPGGNGNGNGVPPPVGLCLPIDDYVYLLMAVGVMYGCYKVRDFNVV